MLPENRVLKKLIEFWTEWNEIKYFCEYFEWKRWAIKKQQPLKVVANRIQLWRLKGEASHALFDDIDHSQWKWSISSVWISMLEANTRSSVEVRATRFFVPNHPNGLTSTAQNLEQKLIWLSHLPVGESHKISPLPSPNCAVINPAAAASSLILMWREPTFAFI